MNGIRKISALETFVVRHPVLRAGKPIQSCQFDGDDLVSTQHLGLFENNMLIGVISLFEAANDIFTPAHQIQIRGMAVLQDHQKKGVGERLINDAEEYARQQQVKVLWFNAREVAVGFYKKMGYSIIGNPFDIPDVGIHFVMYKDLAG